MGWTGAVVGGGDPLGEASRMGHEGVSGGCMGLEMLEPGSGRFVSF